jgi:hypothetical protein
VVFPQVLRTPWINPERRRHVVLTSILALVVVAGIAFIGGLAAAGGGNGHDNRGPVGCVAPGLRMGHGNGKMPCGGCQVMPRRYACYAPLPGRVRPPGRQPAPVPSASSATPAPSPSPSASKTK